MLLIVKGRLLSQCAFVAGGELAGADVFGSVGRKENWSDAVSPNPGFLQLVLITSDMLQSQLPEVC